MRGSTRGRGMWYDGPRVVMVWHTVDPGKVCDHHGGQDR